MSIGSQCSCSVGLDLALFAEATEIDSFHTSRMPPRGAREESSHVDYPCMTAWSRKYHTRKACISRDLNWDVNLNGGILQEILMGRDCFSFPSKIRFYVPSSNIFCHSFALFKDLKSPVLVLSLKQNWSSGPPCVEGPSGNQTLVPVKTSR